jgi:4-hydroxybenzoate polyprenyltransferase
LAALTAFAELARGSNLPTVVSNVLVGCAIGARSAENGAIDLPSILWPSLGVSMFYMAGMALNDVVDVEVDRVERPGRPIPSGRVSLGGARVFVVLGLGVGFGVIARFGLPAAVLALCLVAAIVAYDVLHKKIVGSIVLMGACRGLVYLVAAASLAWPFEFRLSAWLSGALAAYTIAITLIAMGETRQQIGRRRWVALVLPPIVLMPALTARPESWTWSVVAGLAVTGWLSWTTRHVFARPPRTVRAVLNWLSGMCLVDAFFLTLLGHAKLACVAVACFVITAGGHRRIPGT